MAATFRQIVNNVLVNIGSATIPPANTTITDTYMLQVANFVNHIKEEVEAAAQWSAITSVMNLSYPGGGYTFTATLPIGAVSGTLTTNFTGTTGQYNVTFSANDVRLANLTNGATTCTWTGGLLNGTATGFVFAPYQRAIDPITGAYFTSDSRLRRMYKPEFGREVAMVFDTTSFPLPFVMGEMPLADCMYYNSVLAYTPVAYSTNYAFQDTGQDFVNLWVYPGANTYRTIQMWVIIPQVRIDPTVAGTATYPWNGTVGLDSPILVPNRAIEIGASWWALEERGEELGANSMFTEDRFRTLLSDMVSNETGRSGEFQMIIA